METALVPVRSTLPTAAPTGNEPAQTYDPRLFEGPGVEESLLEEWARILDGGTSWRPSHAHAGELLNWPRSREAVEFLSGLDWPHVHDGPQPLRNPLSVMRPPEIASFSSYKKLVRAPTNWGVPDRDPSQEHWGAADADGIRTTEQHVKRYADLLHAYDSFAYAVAGALNLAVLADRLAAITQALQKGYQNVQPPPNTYGVVAVPESKNTERAHRWLGLILLSMLDHPDDRVTLLGRLRALEILRELDPQALTQALTRSEHEGWCVLAEAHRVRLPWSFVPQGADPCEELASSRAAQNEKVQHVWVRTGNTTDWTRTTNRLIHESPREAIQLSFLMMQNCDVEGALIFLQTIPALHRSVIVQMLGQSATFRVDNKLMAGVTMAVLTGMGLLADTRYDDDLEHLTFDALLVYARGEKLRNRDLEEQLAEADLALSRLAWRNDTLTGATVYDPRGYYKTLGLHPSLFEGRSEEEAQAILTRVWRVIADKRHPDKAPPGEREAFARRFQEAEEAKAVLIDPVTRALYDQGRL
jgi:hypothetical protein